jgi:hypothetical protein
LKVGRYFSIPESGTELQSLWNSAEALDDTTVPFWLKAAYRGYFRRLSIKIPIDSGPLSAKAFNAEFQALQEAGIIVEADIANHDIWHLYLSRPNQHPWSIGIYSGPSPLLLSPAPEVCNPVLTRDDVKDVLALFVADPFLIRTDHGWYMFFEVMNARTRKGEIALAMSSDGWHWVYQQIVLREAFHMSYPYVFEWEGSYYMVPETFEAQGVRLYRASRFPLQWEFIGTLISCPYIVDASLLRNGSSWWLWADTSPRRQHDQLRLYHAQNLLGPWYSHVQAPIIGRDPTAGRPAGRVIRWSLKMIRYAQVCIPTYGAAVRAFEITELTEASYSEQECGSEPILLGNGSGWNANGMHHIDAHLLSNSRWIAAVDGR